MEYYIRTLIEGVADVCAALAFEQGATHPWGDGAMLPGDIAFLNETLGHEASIEEAKFFEDSFRDTLRIYTEHCSEFHAKRYVLKPETFLPTEEGGE